MLAYISRYECESYANHLFFKVKSCYFIDLQTYDYHLKSKTTVGSDEYEIKKILL